jgi:formate dehydrogenase subunit gamma
MTIEYDSSIATEIIQQSGARPEMLVQILHAFVDRFGYVSVAAMRQIAGELNISRADIMGVVSFYHDFRTEAPGKRVLKVCQAEACQAMGSRDLALLLEKKFGMRMNETSADGDMTLEAVYCLGNCACSPAVMLDNKVYGRVDAARLDAILDAEAV